ncbi:MAG: hypothetical protein K2F99_05130, partial [Muribaculaceae bacterium]|nr:hypothetical protein [Muribaculaceae bacterium]
MAKNIRDNLRKVAGTSGKYFEGSAKLFLASTKDLAKTSLPTVGDMIDTNRDVVVSTIKFMRNPGDVINRQVERITQSDTLQALNKWKDAALEDLKSGEFYDPERDRTEFGQDTSDLLDNSGDIDMSGFDEDGEYNEDDLFDMKALEHDEKLQESHEEASDARTIATIGAIRK